MKILIHFNALDKPENMGISQLTEDLEQFLSERSEILIDYQILSDRFTFTKVVIEGVPQIGYALTFQVPDDFQN
jgi:hypothetical protein